MAFRFLILPLLLGSVLLAGPGFAQGRSTKGEKPLSIAQGQRVELGHFLVKGRLTLFNFTSEYCPPCRAYADPLYQLHRQRDGVAVVKVDINRPEIHRIDWESPVAQQFELRSIPYFRIYGPTGQLVAEGVAARRLVDEWISQLQ